MQRAFEIYPYCAMALNYLANHFFFTGQHFLVEQLTETALAVTNHGPTKSHSYYNLARSYHSKVWSLFFHFPLTILFWNFTGYICLVELCRRLKGCLSSNMKRCSSPLCASIYLVINLLNCTWWKS